MFDIELKRDGEENLYTQIYEAIRAEILADKYTPDTKMPSIRNLASRLSVNAETVVKAYDLLADENLIYKKEGSGSYIAPAAALKSNSDDQRLRILSSKAYSAPAKVIDFSGPENSNEYLEEYSWDLIFDRFFSDFKGSSFKGRDLEDLSWFELLKNNYSEIKKEKFYYSSKEQLQDILSVFINNEQELLFAKGTELSLFNSIFNQNQWGDEGQEFNTGKSYNFIDKQKNIKVTEADYDSLMDYLEENTIDYLFISDESVENNLLNWSLSKLKSLLELADMLKFKVIILEFFNLYQDNEKIKELLTSKYQDEIILIQSLTDRVFPGLELGLLYLPQENDFEEPDFNYIYDNYSLNKIEAERKFSAGENLINNLLSYYLDNEYLPKRIKFLKQRLKNRKLLLQETIREHFRGVETVENSSLFFLKLKLNQQINQHDFKIFAEKNSILLPDYRNFLSAEKSSELIISPAALNQFAIKQGVMALAKIYWQFIS